MTTESKIFRLNPLQCVSIMVGRYAVQWIVAGALFLFVALITGLLVDIRIIVLALMAVCLLAPILLAWLYYHYGLQGESYLNIVDHKISMEEGRFTVHVAVKKDVPVEDGEIEDHRHAESGEGIPEFRDFTFPLVALGQYNVGKDNVVFPFVGQYRGFLYVPVSAFDEEDGYLSFIKKLSKEKD